MSASRHRETPSCYTSRPMTPEEIRETEMSLDKMLPRRNEVMTYTVLNPRGRSRHVTLRVGNYGLNAADFHDRVAREMGVPKGSFDLVAPDGFVMRHAGMYCPAENEPGDPNLYELVPHGRNPILFDATRRPTCPKCA